MRDLLDRLTRDIGEVLEAEVNLDEPLPDDEGHDANGSPVKDWPAEHRRAREWRAMQKAIDAGVD